MQTHDHSQVRRPATKSDAYQQALRVTWVGVFVILMQGAAKVIAGWLSNSSALLADGLENAADLGVSLAAIIGLAMAGRPADADHPYGHGKAEALTALTIAWVMVLMAIAMAHQAMDKIARRAEIAPPQWWALLFLAGACVTGEGLYRYKIWQARRLGSAALFAEAVDHRKDVFSSLIALVAVGAAVLFGGRAAVLDPIAALITCGFIGWMSLKIIRESAPHLMDRAITGQLLDDIRDIAMSVPGVKGTEKLVARRSGLNVLVELHIEVDPRMSVWDAHEVASRVRDRAIEQIESITDVLVHVEPYIPPGPDVPGQSSEP